jgi:uncharacterized protein YegJ (DUF2314 family)
MPSPVVLVILVVLAVIGFRYLQAKSLPETLVNIDPNDPVMLKAISDAQDSLPTFWEKHGSALNPADFSLKVRFEGDQKVESMWVSDPRQDGDKVSGIVDQSPAFLSIREGERVTFEPSQIRDWMYTESAMIHGNFTGRIMGKPHGMTQRQYQAILDSFAPLQSIDKNVATSPVQDDSESSS